ncbi:MAG: formylglycine-generating enzyme family protein [Myxococcales bacterium]|nr:formylglycine-generating enzyme family protein [Myxococcales bacterium]
MSLQLPWRSMLVALLLGGCLPDLPPIDKSDAADGAAMPGDAAREPVDGRAPPPDRLLVDEGTPIDRGPPVMDRGPVVDQGLPPIDRGPPEVDEGPPPVDRGLPPVDEGPPPVDEGPPPVDEGPPDGPVRCRGEAAPPCNGCPAGTELPDGWVCVPAGEFIMGVSDALRAADRLNTRDFEIPQRRVRISRALLVRSKLITRAEWRAAFGNDPNASVQAPCDDCAASWTSWFDALAYANEASRALGLPECFRLSHCQGTLGVGPLEDQGRGYACDDDVAWDRACPGVRLATEAEWEYFTRAGTSTIFWSGDEPADLARVDWYGGNSGHQPRPVARKPPNPWGLYDVHGSVEEWTLDAYAADFYGERAAIVGENADVDPFAVVPGGSSRVARSCDYEEASELTAPRCGSAARGWARIDTALARTGIRLVRLLPAP